ncbi:hypothetical protein ACIPSJ_27325 [Streptomyces sp. NPDC090088]|uniref:hypothetical protein n=1 Tax=Streptomyces sp. NPDC090088 TaxID=3365944 RepID=UPI003804E06B
MSDDSTPGRQPLRASDVYGPLMVTMLNEQSARKASVEQRSLAVITSSGALVSLLVALSALLLGKDAELRLQSGTRVSLIAAVVAFVLAAVLALGSNSPRSYRDFAAEDVDRMLTDWHCDGEDARWLVSQAQADFLKRAKSLNDTKAHLLQGAVAMEVVGVALVALGVLLALAS